MTGNPSSSTTHGTTETVVPGWRLEPERVPPSPRDQSRDQARRQPAPRLPAEFGPQFTARGDRRFRPDIQGLRAVAVILVVLYHSGVPGLPGGYVGVDVFFVISGFLITRQLVTEARATGTVSLSRFYARRIRRLLPAALLVILVTVAVDRIWGPALQSTAVAKDGLFAAIYSINYWLAAQGVDYQHAAGPLSPFQHFWSLAVEEQFYIIWPLIVLLAATLTRGPLRRIRMTLLTILLLTVGALSLHESITVTTTNAPLAYFSLQTRGWELAVGALIAMSIPLLRRLPGWVASPLSWLGIAAILGSALRFTDSTPFPGSLAAIPVAGAALVIITGLRERRGSAEVLLRPRVMQFFGTMSYGWYLWHWPAIVLAPYLFRTAFDWPEKLEVSFIALWLAVMTYLIIERPMSGRAISRPKWFALGAGMTAATVAVTLTLSILVPPSLAGLGPAATSLSSRLTASTLAGTIAASTDTLTVPSNVTPSLASAASDLPVTSTDGCHLDFTTTSQPPCVFGDVGAARTILIFGDSHAEQWFGAIDAIGKTEHWQVVSWTKSACPVAKVAFTLPELKRRYSECSSWRAATLDNIATLRPDLIIASQADTLAGPTYSSTRWATKTSTTVKALAAIAPVVFLGDTPHPTRDVAACLSENLTSVGRCDVTSDAAKTNAYLEERRIAVTAALSDIDVPVIDPTNWFCGGSTCPAIVANTLVYRDASHMTQYYSRALEPVLLAALAPQLTAAAAAR